MTARPGLPIYGQAPALESERWRSVKEQAKGGEAPRGEFPPGATLPPNGVSRRHFLEVMGAAAGLAGLAACKPPREKVVSFVRAPPDVAPSTPSAYATAMSRGGYALGVVVTSWEGRPTKIEGNREHPASLGGTDALLQAEVLELYDPARTRGFVRGGRHLSRLSLLEELSLLSRGHEGDQGARLRFLVEPSSSPTLGELRRRILGRFPKARFCAWAPLGEEQSRAGAALSFGRVLDVCWSLGEADVILALDADLLGRDGEPLRQAREYASRRVDPDRLNRLYVAEASYSITGGVADHRFRMRSVEVLAFARALAAELSSRHGLSALAPLGAPAKGELQRAVAAVAKDLSRSRGRSLVAVGPRQPPEVHALAAAMNEALGNPGRTLSYRPPALLDPDDGPASLARLVEELGQGAVDTLVVTAWNPLYTAPADLDLRRAFGAAKERIVLSLRPNETWAAATWRVAASHPLEAWGDLRSRDGTATIVQPLISPLAQTVSEVELLAGFLDQGDLGDHALVKNRWRAVVGEAALDRAFDGWLAQGLVPGSGAAGERPSVDLPKVAAALEATKAAPAGIEVEFVADYKVLDGRYLENAWLAEFPHPITKLTWDNAAYLSPATAERLKLRDRDEIKITLDGRSVVAGAMVVPGHADDAITLPLGYGQAGAGEVGKGSGFDAFALRTGSHPYFALGAEIRRTGGRVDLVTTQEHFSMEGRAIALALDAPDLAGARAELDEHRGAAPTVLSPVDYSQQEYRWGMAIDLSRCIGCGACTIACQAENNIPTVGKAQVARSREMHWLRVDRYFEGDLAEPRSVSQPLACVHCEAAPCEYVCPVNATVHSEEGLNEMVYNRCVGTRYCSNNCPYKVRRFNFFDYHQRMGPTLRMLENPDVTVRSRGVMEKCTYCTQRIERARILDRGQGKKIGGDEVVSACQQACPTEAIVFGNLADPESAVSRRHRDERRYDLLHELGTRPRTAYLVRLRNPNPELS
ncbi:MAG TPA: 4Fe-4S dicluster domain-containing protein [Anaeromyxobacter sp.]|nr:4Fe-4S dicluster domain-containing protein [Anaeromyxobacter sp.]